MCTAAQWFAPLSHKGRLPLSIWTGQMFVSNDSIQQDVAYLMKVVIVIMMRVKEIFNYFRSMRELLVYVNEYYR